MSAEMDIERSETYGCYKPVFVVSPNGEHRFVSHCVLDREHEGACKSYREVLRGQRRSHIAP